MMTPEQRLDRAERILLLTIKAGRRARKEWNEKVNILIDAQIRNEAACRAGSENVDKKLAELAESQKRTDAALAESAESHKRTDAALAESAESHKRTDAALAESAESHKRIDAALAELAESHKLTDAALREYLNSQRKGKNGKSR